MQETSPTQFRKSHLLRTGSESWAQLEQTIAPFLHNRREPPGVLKFTSIAGGDQLVAALRADYVKEIAELVEESVSLEAVWKAKLLRQVRLNPGCKIDAYLDASGAQAEIQISEGLCFALDDALLTALCVLGFFTARSETTDIPEAYFIAECGPEHADRFFDYRRTKRLSLRRLPSALTGVMPLDRVRLAQSDLLLSLALRWVSLHEQAHWLLGHLE